MKILRYTLPGQEIEASRLGILIDGEVIGDLQAAYLTANATTNDKADAARLFPDELTGFLRAGPAAMEALDIAQRYLSERTGGGGTAVAPDGTRLFLPLSDIVLHAPLRPPKIIAVGRNYKAHLEEAHTDIPSAIPSSWIKASSAVCGPNDDILKPAAVEELDYETEMCLVIGTRCKNVPESEAYDVIAGYMVGNDISARDVVRRERAEGNQMLGKMFDTFAPLGPWMVTRDEIPDPMALGLRTRVSGVTRQDGNTAMMIWSVPQMIAFLSQMTLEPGDVIMTGTPSGVASGYKRAREAEGKPEVAFDWYLNDGDLLESEIDGLGTLRNRIVDDPAEQPSWRW
jgi:acylpyruvate hydrolase